ncbi:Arb2 domain-containing protein [Xylariaceae sp. FL1272]|nr:Arb2 domain-containing protein [Xylariaceae sp. FL1272]
MFVRKWSGLPADPQFPTNLKDLGYFVNEDDEVRLIENPDYYFKFFINRNPRWNERQRFSMHQSVQGIIFERLEALGMQKTILPLGQTDLTTPHVPIFMSKDIDKASRVVVIVGETHQDLGVLAWRVACGPGGVNKGSMVSIVKELQKQQSSPTDANPPGIILANIGELTWWDGGKRTVNRIAFEEQPMASACHSLAYLDFSGAFQVPGNDTAKAHMEYIFDKIISDPKLIRPDAKIDLLALGDGADVLTTVLNDMWPGPDRVWDKRINCFANVGGGMPAWYIDNKDFLEGFMKERSRVWFRSDEPLDTVLSTPAGNKNTTTFTELGSYIFSAGDAGFTETLITYCHPAVLGFINQVAHFVPFTITTMHKGDDGKTEMKETVMDRFRNPEFGTAYRDDPQEPNNWSKWAEEHGVALPASAFDLPDRTKGTGYSEEIGSDGVPAAVPAETDAEPDAEAEPTNETEEDPANGPKTREGEVEEDGGAEKGRESEGKEGDDIVVDEDNEKKSAI